MKVVATTRVIRKVRVRAAAFVCTGKVPGIVYGSSADTPVA